MSLEKIWVLKVTKSVNKQTRKFPEKDKERIFEAMRSLSKDPYSGDVEKLVGEKNSWRRRIGKYRIFYELDAGRRIILVSEVKRRTSKTY